MKRRKRIDCHKCRHYYVTWQESTPHGCRAIGFKSARLPSETVFRTSGADCLYFDPRSAVLRSGHWSQPKNKISV